MELRSCIYSTRPKTIEFSQETDLSSQLPTHLGNNIHMNTCTRMHAQNACMQIDACSILAYMHTDRRHRTLNNCRPASTTTTPAAPPRPPQRQAHRPTRISAAYHLSSLAKPRHLISTDTAMRRRTDGHTIKKWTHGNYGDMGIIET